MSNPIKYTTGSESLALKKGNFYIGTGDVGKGPTSTTGYYNGIDPPTSGYTIYLNKSTGGPSIYTASNDSELISLTNSIASQSYTTVNECLNYFNGQTDKLCVNRNYEGIVTDGLVFNLDAGFTPSYPRNGTTLYDISNKGNDGSLINGPTFNSSDGGYLVFDGTNDYVNVSNFSGLNSNPSYTMMTWMQFGNLSLLNYVDSNIMWYGGTSKRAAAALEQKGSKFCSLHYSDDVTFNSFSPVINTPYHAVMTYDSSSRVVKLYVNGSFIQSGTHGGNLNITSQTLRVGGGPREWRGKIATSQIYDRVLSADEILQNYNAQKGRFGL